ncbi:MAG TPA: cytochrome c3 family protein [bacterium]|nr:cytochrome c3 family protein [bacterium]
MKKPTMMASAPVVQSALLAALALCAPAAAQTGSSSCITCHTRLTDARPHNPTVRIHEDVHLQKGLSCHNCHGGNPAVGAAEEDASLAHDFDKGFVGAPATADIPAFCDRCHGDVEFMKQYNPKLRVDQLLEYKSSHHGKALAEGNTDVATCVSCHGVHGILPISDTRSPVYKTNVAATCTGCHANAALMARYGFPHDQKEKYARSVHGRKLAAGDLAAPTCNNCHGNHGATPPGLTSIANACGECHANNRDFFNESPHKAAFAELGVADCIICHNHHDIAEPDDRMIGTGSGSMCITCHAEGEPGYQAAAYMAHQLDSLKTALAAARGLLDRAARGGVNVALGKFDMHAADDALIKARTAIHYFDTTKFGAVIAAGLADAGRVIAHGENALDDLRLRRLGLGFSLPLIMLVALGLVLKIRALERNHPSRPQEVRHMPLAHWGTGRILVVWAAAAALAVAVNLISESAAFKSALFFDYIFQLVWIVLLAPAIVLTYIWANVHLDEPARQRVKNAMIATAVILILLWLRFSCTRFR